VNEAIELAKRELWFRGDISWKLHSAQEHLDSVYRKVKGQLFVGNCSRQWGKSFWAVTKAIEVAINKPKSQIRYVSSFQSDLVDFIIPAFDKILEDCPRSIKGKKVGKFYVFPNGSRIKLVGLDKNPNGLRGNTLDLVIIDECGFVASHKLDYIYKSIIVPASLHRPECRFIFISTPPSTPAHSFLDYVQKAETEGSYSKFDIYSNPRITDADIERMAKEMGGKTSTTFRRECLCEFVTDSDLAIIPEWKDEFVKEIPRDEFFPYYHKYVGMDLGVKDFTAAIFGYFDFKRASLIIEDEFMMSGPSMNTHLLVGAIRKKENELWDNKENPKDVNNNPVPFRRISDNNWPIMMLDFSSLHNLTFIETNKDNLEAMINEVRLMVQAGQIIVHPKCVQLIGCLKYGVWDDKKKKFANSKTYGHFDHLAALVYLVRNLAKHTNPIPVDHGFHRINAFTEHIKDRKNISANAKTISESLIKKSPTFNTSVRRRGR
jgi:hypothetical protein